MRSRQALPKYLPAAMLIGIGVLWLLQACAPVPALKEVMTDRLTATLVQDTSFGRFIDAVALESDRLGNLFVLDRGGSTLIELNAHFDSIRTVNGLGRDHNQFDQPADLDARQANNLFVADYGNHRVEQYSRELAYLATLQTRDYPEVDQRFGYPSAISLDDAGNIYLIDGENRRVIRANSQFQIDRIIGAYTNAVSPEAVLHDPRSIAVDAFNDLVVLDQNGTRLVTFDNLGNVLANRKLESPLSKIRTFRDTLVGLLQSTASQPFRVQLFNSRTLGSRGVWEVGLANSNSLNPASSDSSKVVAFGDIDLRGATVLLLGQHAVFRFKLLRQ